MPDRVCKFISCKLSRRELSGREKAENKKGPRGKITLGAFHMRMTSGYYYGHAPIRPHTTAVTIWSISGKSGCSTRHSCPSLYRMHSHAIARVHICARLFHACNTWIRAHARMHDTRATRIRARINIRARARGCKVLRARTRSMRRRWAQNSSSFYEKFMDFIHLWKAISFQISETEKRRCTNEKNKMDNMQYWTIKTWNHVLYLFHVWKYREISCFQKWIVI